MDYTSDDASFKPLRVCDLSLDDRPREKAWQRGIDTLSSAELIAIILGGGIQGLSVLDLAKKLLSDNGGKLTSVRRTGMKEMTRKYAGIGPAKAVALAAAFELGARARDQEVVPEKAIRCSADVYELKRDLSDRPHEEFWVLSLSRSHKVKDELCLSRGGTVATVVDVKLLLKWAVESLADSLILIHNHPSGSITPSPEDDNLTRKIAEAAKVFDIRVLDHVIIGDGTYYSYAESGKL